MSVREKTTAISIRIPDDTLAILKARAKQLGVGYQVLLKRWVAERLSREIRKLPKEDRAGFKETLYLRKHFPDLLDRIKKSKTAASRRRAVRAEDVGY